MKRQKGDVIKDVLYNLESECVVLYIYFNYSIMWVLGSLLLFLLVLSATTAVLMPHCECWLLMNLLLH